MYHQATRKSNSVVLEGDVYYSEKGGTKGRVVCYSETSANFHQTAWRGIQQLFIVIAVRKIHILHLFQQNIEIQNKRLSR
jgi:hypothetical protein